MQLHDQRAVKLEVGSQQAAGGDHLAQHVAHRRRVVVAGHHLLPGTVQAHQRAADRHTVEQEALQGIGLVHLSESLSIETV
ncbi:hypothetical protein D3C71_1726580 [compost metagenome]